MFPSIRINARAVLCLSVATCLWGQSKPEPDVIVFVDGERLVGELKSATSKQLVFKSDMGFEVHVGWAKIKELHSNKRFAAIPLNFVARRSAAAGEIPQGTIELAKESLEVKPTPTSEPKTVPLNTVSNVIEEKAFEHALQKQGFLSGWSGAGNLGVGLTSATITTRSFNTGLQLTRTDPSEDWLQTRNRTIVLFNSIYQDITQSGVAPTKINIIHGEAAQDRFLNKRWFVFGGATFDHHLSQGLKLLQAYGGGVGINIINTENTQFEARAGFGFMHQEYTRDPQLTKTLVGSRFGQSYTRRFSNGMSFHEDAGIRTAWTDLENYFAGGTVSLTIPVYRRLGITFSGLDTYTNLPPTYFKRNSVTGSMGVNYTFK